MVCWGGLKAQAISLILLTMYLKGIQLDFNSFGLN